MQITEFCKIYGVDRHEVDYWTRAGFLHPYVRPNGYRDYGEQAERELRLILVAQMLDYPGSLESKLDMLHDLDEDQWRNLLDKLRNKYNRFTRKYNAAYDLVANKTEGRD